MNGILAWIDAMPAAAKWGVALLGLALGLAGILATDRVVSGVRRWLLRQLRWVRRPAYRRFVKLYGWLLFILGMLLALLLVLMGGH